MISSMVMTEMMIRKTRYFRHLIGYMQKRMREKCETLDAKLEMIKQLWDMKLFQWFTKAT